MVAQSECIQRRFALTWLIHILEKNKFEIIYRLVDHRESDQLCTKNQHQRQRVMHSISNEPAARICTHLRLKNEFCLSDRFDKNPSELQLGVQIGHQRDHLHSICHESFQLLWNDAFYLLAQPPNFQKTNFQAEQDHLSIEKVGRVHLSTGKAARKTYMTHWSSERVRSSDWAF